MTELIKIDKKEIDKLDSIKKQAFIGFYCQDEVRGSPSVSCAATGISRQTYYDWLEKDEKFREIIKDAKLQLCDDMEQVLIGRAVEKDTTALIYWLKYNHPTYKETPANINIHETKILVMPTELIGKYDLPSKSIDSSK